MMMVMMVIITHVFLNNESRDRVGIVCGKGEQIRRESLIDTNREEGGTGRMRKKRIKGLSYVR